ncbi:hypothetical protein ILUMI_08974 [Ignelater luminosus]|uniref:Uncharacterized protein n=1 Tax=Ignelater luminosus TaxID=2038154 RepID=A0A8K0D0P8_IGNLU|nr:hypothetical protein ILUMI_08974 [Ignelater luminosus]
MVTAVENFRNLSLLNSYTNYEGSKIDSNLMHREAERLKSYDNWPLDFIEPKNLAEAGFYYTKNNDLVRCAFCKIEIMKWQQGDDALTEHSRWSENCPLVRGVDCGNIPLDGSVSFSSQTMDNKKYCGIEIRPNSFPEWGPMNLNSKLHRKLDQSKQGPRYSEYKCLENRLKSFREWPQSIKQTSEKLAAAGFYYNGKGDQTICFQCGLGLRDWADGDDPWEQHAKWSSRCSFLHSQKGAEYVSEVSSRQKPVLTPEEVAELQVDYNNKIPSSKVASNDRFSASVTHKSKDNQTKEATAKQKSNNLCKLCNLKEKCILFLPCRHIVVCEDCSPSLTTCLACNKPLEATIKVELSM